MDKFREKWPEIGSIWSPKTKRSTARDKKVVRIDELRSRIYVQTIRKDGSDGSVEWYHKDVFKQEYQKKSP